MAVSISFNPDIFSIYQTFYATKRVDLIESLAWIVNDEKSMGVSKEHGTLIIYLAQFYFTIIQVVEQSKNPNWTYLDWLTQAEYDKIMNKLSLGNATPNIINVPGASINIAPVAPIADHGEFTRTITIVGSEDTVTRISLSLRTKPYSVQLSDSDGNILTSLAPKFVLVDGFYCLDLWSIENLSNVELKIIY
jgi:hypothetical protein